MRRDRLSVLLLDAHFIADADHAFDAACYTYGSIDLNP
jgi:hypothetical protein